jgi:hypothetical protein
MRPTPVVIVAFVAVVLAVVHVASASSDEEAATLFHSPGRSLLGVDEAEDAGAPQSVEGEGGDGGEGGEGDADGASAAAGAEEGEEETAETPDVLAKWRDGEFEDDGLTRMRCQLFGAWGDFCEYRNLCFDSVTDLVMTVPDNTQGSRKAIRSRGGVRFTTKLPLDDHRANRKSPVQFATSVRYVTETNMKRCVGGLQSLHACRCRWLHCTYDAAAVCAVVSGLM